jgi:hypothetical protein
MTRPTFPRVLLLMACCAPALVAQTQSGDPKLSDVMAAFNQRLEANREGDTERIERLMAAEYVQTDISGYVQNKTTWLNEYFRPLAQLIKAGKFRWEVFDTKVESMSVYNRFAAVIVGTLEAKGRGATYDAQKHTWVEDANGSFGGTLRFTHVYIQRDGVWLLAALHNAVPFSPPSAR